MGLGLFGLRAIPLIGREGEQDRLWSALREVHETGAMRALVLQGPTGGGKSHLVRWFTRRAGELGGASIMTATHSPIASAADGLAAMITHHLGCSLNHPEDVERALSHRFPGAGPDSMDDFRPFEDSEEVRLTRGGQGSYMLEFQLDAAGARDLDCLLFAATGRIDGGEAAMLSLPAEFHCGQTRRLYLIINPPAYDEDACLSGVEEAAHPLELTVSLPGLDEVTYSLTLMHPTCPIVGAEG